MKSLTDYVPKSLKRAGAIAALGLAALTSAYSGRANAANWSLNVNDYLSSTTQDVYHITLDTNPTTTETAPGTTDTVRLVHWPGIQNFTDRDVALNFDSGTTLPLRLHVFPRNFGGATITRSNFQLVGQSAPVVLGGLGAYTSGITVPSDAVAVTSRIVDQYTTNTAFVNLVFILNAASEEMQLTGTTETLVLGNFFYGARSSDTSIRPLAGLTLGQTAVKNTVYGNMFNRFYRQPADAGQCVSVRGESEFGRNIFSESKDGIAVYNTAKIAIGSTTDSKLRDNVFVGNLTTNIVADIGDVSVINAQLATWYDVGLVALATSTPKTSPSSWGNPLSDEAYIKSHTIKILNPTPLSPVKSSSYIQKSTIKDVLIHPIKLGDPRFGYLEPVNAVRDWSMYDQESITNSDRTGYTPIK